MKRLFSAMTPGDEGTLQLLKSVLKEAAIGCVVRNESLSVAKGDIPASECFPELWVMDDKDYPKAREIVEEWKRSGLESHPSWVCTKCQETNEGQFTSCWQCGTDKD